MTPAATIPTVTLNDDNTIPVLGVGVAELSAAEAEAASADDDDASVDLNLDWRVDEPLAVVR